jgi:hypothetical protein
VSLDSKKNFSFFYAGFGNLLRLHELGSKLFATDLGKFLCNGFKKTLDFSFFLLIYVIYEGFTSLAANYLAQVCIFILFLFFGMDCLEKL